MPSIDKMRQQVVKHLVQGEEVLAAVQGLYETAITVRPALMVATESRVLSFAKKVTGYAIESFPYAHISSFEQSKNIRGHAITFYAANNYIIMKQIRDASAMHQFVATVKDGMTSASATPAAAPSPKVNQGAMPTPQVGAQSGDKASILDAIDRLSNLREQGIIISDAEFSAKKADLLERL